MALSSHQIEKLKNYIAQLKPKFLGKFLYYVFPFRKRVIFHNFKIVFGNQISNVEKIKLAQAFYGHLFKSIWETLSLRFISMEKLKQRVTVKGHEHLLKLLDQNIQSAILITGHFGSWEFAPIAGMMQFPQFYGKFYFVRKMLKNKWLEKVLFGRYQEAGLNVIPKKNSLHQVCDVLETGGVVVFVFDQHASLKNRDGLSVDFFGQATGTYRSPAMIAKYTQVPVLSARSYRQVDGHHILEFFPVIPWIGSENEAEELVLNLQQYNKVIEQFILDYPEQWIWIHKRWKTRL